MFSYLISNYFITFIAKWVKKKKKKRFPSWLHGDSYIFILNYKQHIFPLSQSFGMHESNLCVLTCVTCKYCCKNNKPWQQKYFKDDTRWMFVSIWMRVQCVSFDMCVCFSTCTVRLLLHALVKRKFL